MSALILSALLWAAAFAGEHCPLTPARPVPVDVGPDPIPPKKPPQE